MGYLFLPDISGSMGIDGKLLLSKDSAEVFVDELAEPDRFEVTIFSVQTDWAFSGMRPADPQAKDAARVYMEHQQAWGGAVLVAAMTPPVSTASPTKPSTWRS